MHTCITWQVGWHFTILVSIFINTMLQSHTNKMPYKIVYGHNIIFTNRYCGMTSVNTRHVEDCLLELLKLWTDIHKWITK